MCYVEKDSLECTEACTYECPLGLGEDYEDRNILTVCSIRPRGDLTVARPNHQLEVTQRRVIG